MTKAITSYMKLRQQIMKTNALHDALLLSINNDAKLKKNLKDNKKVLEPIQTARDDISKTVTSNFRRSVNAATSAQKLKDISSKNPTSFCTSLESFAGEITNLFNVYTKRVETLEKKVKLELECASDDET